MAFILLKYQLSLPWANLIFILTYVFLLLGIVDSYKMVPVDCTSLYSRHWIDPARCL